MSTTKIQQSVKLGESATDGAIILISKPKCQYLNLIYSDGCNKNRTYAINKMDLIKLGEKGKLDVTTVIDSEDYFQSLALNKEHIKLEFSSDGESLNITRVNNVNKNVLLNYNNTNKDITSTLLSALRIQRAVIKITSKDYFVMKNELLNIGFSDDLSDNICFKISIHPNVTNIVDTFDDVSKNANDIIEVLQKNDVLNPARYNMNLFTMREKCDKALRSHLTKAGISTVKDVLDFCANNPDGLRSIVGIGKAYENIINKNIEIFRKIEQI